MTQAASTNRLAGFPEALAARQQAGAGDTFEALHLFIDQELRERGFQINRFSLGVETLHPVRSGTQLIMIDGAFEERSNATRAIVTTDSYLQSPTYVVDQTLKPFRWRRGETTQSMGLLEAVQADGFTDYIIFPMPFLDASRTATLSFATQSPEGYSDQDISDLEQAVALISPYAERIGLREISVNLLDTYVGRQSGERVMAGEIDRGVATEIEAAVLMTDMRGFTRFTNDADAEVVLERLNRWFECVGTAVEAREGEILKFMGDGVLAIFLVSDTPQEACGRAYAAASDIVAQVTALSEETPELAFQIGIGLHIGHLAYGNVGSKSRLDFTVIGPTVNLASRIETATKRLERPILASKVFADLLGDELKPIGTIEARGFNQPVAVYG